jgi:glycosyltransferase involved in cell wall biosynthesis
VPRAPRILTTLYFPHRPAWASRVTQIDPSRHSLPGRLWTLLRRAREFDAIILNAGGHDDQFAAILLRRLRPKVHLVLSDCTWKLEPSRLVRGLSRLAVRLMDGPRVHYCVFSADEAARFPHTWGVDRGRVHVTHWYVGWSEEEFKAPISEGGYVFSGGDSMRDYRALIEAARDVPAEVRIASHLSPPIAEADLPGNVRYGPIPSDQYFTEMRGASVVVVCLLEDSERSAGQNNYIGPMALGKLVVVNDTTAVREYVDPGRTALVVPSGDADALADAIRWALDPANAAEARAIVERGKRDVMERFPPQRYAERLIEVAESAAS